MTSRSEPPLLTPTPSPARTAGRGIGAPVLLSPHFTLDELVRSSTAIRLGRPNELHPDGVLALRGLCAFVLEPIRARLSRPLIIESGHRAPWLNALVGGQPNSQHMTDPLRGAAADFRPLDLDLLTAFREIVREDPDEGASPRVHFDQLILERYTTGTTAGWIHVSWRPGTLRREVLTVTSDGKTTKGINP